MSCFSYVLTWFNWAQLRIYIFGGEIPHAGLSPTSVLMANQLPRVMKGEVSGSRNAYGFQKFRNLGQDCFEEEKWDSRELFPPVSKL
jgi:hypothetical protein